MAALTIAAAMILAATCQNVVDPHTIVGIAKRESGLDPAAVSAPNRDGSRDYGLMQINDRNFAWLGLTANGALDPCRSIAAAARLLASLSRYNTGNPTTGFANGYVSSVTHAIRAVKAATPGADVQPVKAQQIQRPSLDPPFASVFARPSSAAKEK